MKKILIFTLCSFLLLGISYATTLDLESAITYSEKALEQQKSQTWTIKNNDELIANLHEKWLTIHTTRSAFKPEQSIRRDEAAKMLTLSLIYLPQPVGFVQNDTCVFNDLNKVWPDLKAVILQSCDKGLFKWANGSFKPDQSITNWQLMTVLGRMLFWIQSEENGHYASGYVALLEKKWYLAETDLSVSKNWDIAAKRGTLAKLLGKVLEK